MKDIYAARTMIIGREADFRKLPELSMLHHMLTKDSANGRISFLNIPAETQCFADSAGIGGQV